MDTQHWKVFEGQTVDGKYRLQGLLGNGAFGGVFLADETIGSQVIGRVAIKLIMPSSSNQQTQLAELIAMRNLNHPHVVRGLAAGLCVLNGFSLLYLVMDVAEGTLEQHLKTGSISKTEATEIVQSIAEGLAFLHSKNMVHRDLKPGNVLRINGKWQIADFGLIRAFGDDSAAYTQTVAGTPYFMPPESFGGTVSPAWDVWSLGVIIVVAFTRQYPFTGASHHEVAQAIIHQEPRIPSLLSAPFDAVVRGCLIKDRRQRWSAQQILNAFTSKAASVPAPSPQPIASPRNYPQPKPPSLVTQKTVPTPQPVKRSAIPAGLWGFGGLAVGGIIVAHLLSVNNPSSQPVSAPPPINHASRVTQPANVGVKRITRVQTIPFSIQRIRTASLASGQTQIQQQGHAGEMSVAYEVKMHNGHVVSRHVVRRTVAKAPVQEVLLIGERREAPPSATTRVASITPSQHHSVSAVYTPRLQARNADRRTAIVYRRTTRASVGDLHSDSTIGTGLLHRGSDAANSPANDSSDSLH